VQDEREVRIKGFALSSGLEVTTVTAFSATRRWVEGLKAAFLSTKTRHQKARANFMRGDFLLPVGILGKKVEEALDGMSDLYDLWIAQFARR
jgi:hypothetical protein